MRFQETFGKNYSNIGKVLSPYIEILNGAEKDLSMNGKLLEDANKEQAALFYFYDQIRIEIQTYVEMFEGEEKRVRSRLYKDYNETYQRDLGDRTIEKYIDNEPDYLKIHEHLLIIKELYKKYDSLSESFKMRGYALNNITKLRINSLENETV